MQPRLLQQPAPGGPWDAPLGWAQVSQLGPSVVDPSRTRTLPVLVLLSPCLLELLKYYQTHKRLSQCEVRKGASSLEMEP